MNFKKLFIFVLLLSCTKTEFNANHLQGVTSSYLQDSSLDEIWWHHWSSDVLGEAKKRDKLIFLSIGYSSCFACEKMQKLVYSQSDVAQKLNQDFISIKVDREDRPDLDAHFLNMQSLIMGFGAWPINMILTPDLQPVYATTLLDKNPFMQILEKTATAWQKERDKILQGATRFQVQTQVQPSTEDFVAKDQKLIDDFYARYTHRFDTLYGGKGTGQNYNTKFPVNDEMRLLLRYYRRTKDEQALKMVNKTMSTIAMSALFDQIQGGFHRYSITQDWNTPNFEKMLYDQASFIHALIDIQKIKNNELYQNVLEKTVSFLINHTQSPLGGFYSSISGSLEGKDGFFYTWTPQELQSQLTPEEWKTFNEYYTLVGPNAKLSGRYTLRKKTTFVKSDLFDIDKKLREIRDRKGKPLFDPKVITGDNAYLLSALSRLHQMWPSEDLYLTIKRNLDFIISQHKNLKGDWYRRSVHGHVGEQAVLDDYAYLIDSLIEFYQTGFDEKYLKLAYQLQEKQNKLFWNPDRTLFRFSEGDPDLLKDQYLFIDQARPSGQSMSYWNLLRLSRYFSHIEYETMANKLINSYPDQLANDPLVYSSLLLALDFEISKPKSLVIVGQHKDCEQFSRNGFSGLQPYVLFSCGLSSSKIPINRGKKKKDNETTFYVCDTRSCQEPTSDYQKALSYIN